MASWAELTEGLEKTALYESGYYSKLIGDSFDVALVQPAGKKILSYIDRSLMSLEGGSKVTAGTWAEYVNGNIASEVGQINNIVKHGYSNNLTTAQISKRITERYKGVIKNDARSLARTGMSHYTNQAREAMAADNSKVLKKRFFLATFDNRTTNICKGFAGSTWDLKDDAAPVLPLHWGERSSWLLLPEGQEEPHGMRVATGGNKGKDAREAYDKRSSRTDKRIKYRGRKDSVIFDTAQVRVGTTMDAFYKDQPRWWIESNMGKRRADMFIKGEINLKDLTDVSGRSLSLDELAAIDRR